MAKMNPSKLRNVLEALPFCDLSDTKKKAIDTIITKYLNGDIVPVVRCEQCKHRDWRQSLETGKVETICRYPCGLKHPGKDKFCSYGERKDNGESE